MAEHNPYLPPGAPVIEAAAPVPRKPVAVWIVQAIAALFAAVMTYGLVLALWYIEEGWRDGRLGVSDEGLTWYLTQCAALMFMLATIFIVQRRSPWGRWMALVWLAAITLYLLVNMYRDTRYSTRHPMGMFDYLAAGSLLSAPGLLLAYFCAFSKKARAYYSRTESARS